MWRRWFLAHPASMNETYLEHMAIALRFGAMMVTSGLACIAHAVIPAIFTRTASGTVQILNAELEARRSHFRHQQPDSGEWLLDYEI